MDVLAYIIAIGLIIYGIVSLFKDGREKGISAVILEIVGAVLLLIFA